MLFATYFFLADGNRIWGWVVRIFPRASRERADSSGRIAWTSLTAFVRATMLVAFTDALGVMIVAAILKVPFVFAIGVLVFIGAFIPMIGALLSGSVAVLVALVAQGPVVALIMLGGVVAVQQLEAHVLQPFLLGRLVRVHPLAVIVAIAAGVLVAGIAGALVAVPLVAALNAVVMHLSNTGSTEREAEEEPLGDSLRRAAGRRAPVAWPDETSGCSRGGSGLPDVRLHVARSRSGGSPAAGVLVGPVVALVLRADPEECHRDPATPAGHVGHPVPGATRPCRCTLGAAR